MINQLKFYRILVVFLFAAGTGPIYAGESASSHSIAYSCEDGSEIQVEYVSANGQSTAVLKRDGITLTLEQVRAASGTKFSDGTLTWWEKGGESLLIEDNISRQYQCKEQS